jgi:hypothetical protein
VLAGVSLERGEQPFVSTVYYRGAGTDWVVDPEAIERRLREATTAPPLSPPSEAALHSLLVSLSPCVRRLLREASTFRVAGVPLSSEALRLGKRLRALAIGAARRRDATRLELLDQAFRFCTGGHTAGEALLIESMAALDDVAIMARLPTLPVVPARPAPLRPRLTGLIVFQP